MHLEEMETVRCAVLRLRLTQQLNGKIHKSKTDRSNEHQTFHLGDELLDEFQFDALTPVEHQTFGIGLKTLPMITQTTFPFRLQRD